MAASIPTREPLQIRAGDTVKWTKSLADYPADDSWILTYYLVNSSRRFVVVATAAGADHAVTISASDSAKYPANNYSWTARVSKSGEVYTVATGTLEVLTDVTENVDTRSHAKKVLDAVEAVIEGRASLDQENYTIAGRSLSRTPIEDLLVLRDRYKTEYEREKQAERIVNGLGNTANIRVRFC